MEIANIDISQVTFGAPTKTKGGKSVPISYGGEPLAIRMPKMQVTRVFTSDENPSKVTLNVSLADKEERTCIAAAYDFINAFDALVNERLRNNVTTEKRDDNKWLVSSKPVDRLVQTITIKQSDQYGEAWRPGAYLKKESAVFNCDVMDENKTTIADFAHTELHHRHAMLVVNPKLWSNSKGEFGVTWTVSKMRVYPREAMPQITADDAIDGCDILEDEITFSATKDGPGDKKQAYVKHAKRPLVMRTPAMHCQHGARAYRDGDPFYVELSFKDADSNPEVKAFRDAMYRLDTKIRVSVDFLKGPSAPQYQPIVRQSNAQYPATIKALLPPEAEITTADGEPIASSDVQSYIKGGTLSAVLQCTGVWSSKPVDVQLAGVSFKVLKLVVHRAAPLTMRCSMSDGEDDDLAVAAVAGVVDEDDE